MSKPDYKRLFPVGAKVRMKEGAVIGYLAAIQAKVRNGRIGVVTGYSFPNERPMVTLVQDGRKKEHWFGTIIPNDWEVVSLPDENSTAKNGV